MKPIVLTEQLAVRLQNFQIRSQRTLAPDQWTSHSPDPWEPPCDEDWDKLARQELKGFAAEELIQNANPVNTPLREGRPHRPAEQKVVEELDRFFKEGTANRIPHPLEAYRALTPEQIHEIQTTGTYIDRGYPAASWSEKAAAQFGIPYRIIIHRGVKYYIPKGTCEKEIRLQRNLRFSIINGAIHITATRC